MTSKNNSDKLQVGVIGSGSFGTAISNLLAINNRVFLYTRKEEVKDRILKERINVGQQMHENVIPTLDLEEVAGNCSLLFPTVPSASFREMTKQLAPYLNPSHIIIHGTKGLDFQLEGRDLENGLSREQVKTMSEVINEETIVLRVGALAGPNLAGELARGEPAATVIASQFDEVIQMGRKTLRTPNFQVYGNHDIIGVELSGVLKNTIAIASGIQGGMGFGNNARALLITKGLGEMIRLGAALGSDTTAFLGLAGIGDLMATCNSDLSRNYNVGLRLAKGETLEHILETSTEVAEGINTIKIVHYLGKYYSVKIPIIDTLYNVLYKNLTPQKGLSMLMHFSYSKDVDFLSG
jgi:glycerol-3-phosphate dehydrogenase (NAD(P)+)